MDIRDNKIKKLDGPVNKSIAAFHLEDLVIQQIPAEKSTSVESDKSDIQFQLKFNIRVSDHPLMINFMKIISLNKDFLIEDEFEQKYLINRFIIPLQSKKGSNNLNFDIKIICLETKQIKGKI